MGQKYSLGINCFIAFMRTHADRFLAVFFVFLLLFTSSQITILNVWKNKASAAAVSVDPLPTASPKQTPALTQPLSEAAKATALSARDPVTQLKEKQAAEQKQLADGSISATDLASKLKQSAPKFDYSKEDVSKRTSSSYTYQDSTGNEMVRTFTTAVNYKKGNSWQKMTGSPKDDATYNGANKPKESLLDRLLPGKPNQKTGIIQTDGLLRPVYRPLSDLNAISFALDGGGVVQSTVLDANNVNPVLKTSDGNQFVMYEDAWKDATLYYQQIGSELKEFIVVKSKAAPLSYSFKIAGAKLEYGKDNNGKTDGTVIVTASSGAAYRLPALTVTGQKNGPLSNPKLTYKITGDIISVIVDKTWLDSLGDASFPLVIDPTYEYYGFRTTIPGGEYGEFKAYKSDGYVCNSTNCDVYVGTLIDNGPKSWRSMIHMPITQVYGQTVNRAVIVANRINRPYQWSGFDGNKPYWVTWAQCFGFNCISGAPRAFGYIDGGGILDATDLFKWFSQNPGAGDAWMIMWGDEGDTTSFKKISGRNDYTYADVYYRHDNIAPPVPALNTPVDNAVINVSRPTLRMNGVSDPDGDVVKYAFHLMDSSGNVILAHSGEKDTPEWTIPDNLMVDGQTYTWKGWVLERWGQDQNYVLTDWRQTETRRFTYDLRTGMDKTQTIENVGPMNVSLNRGNGYTSVSTHSSSALGGSIALGLSYNTPDLSRSGLTAYYYNETSTGRQLGVQVSDPNIDFLWGTGSPYPGSVQADKFDVNWRGYFIAPEDGVYTFGANSVDDRFTLSFNNISQFDFNCCGSYWSSNTISLKKGQAYPINAWFYEYSGGASVSFKVRLPSGAETVVPSDWLRTLPEASSNTNNGLVASYYKNEDPAGNSNFDITAKTPLVFKTVASNISMDWGTKSLTPYDFGSYYADNMIVNYSGYITIPATGNYTFTTGSDDGSRMYLNDQLVVDNWGSHGYLEKSSVALSLKAGQILPIRVMTFDSGGGASINLSWQSPAGNGVIPAKFFATTAQTVPKGWTITPDANQSIPYESLSVRPNGDVNLMDSTGFLHKYSWNGSGFTPAVNEYGSLIKQVDQSFILNDIDGRSYSFNAAGMLTVVATPTDDRQPAVIKYEYGSSGSAPYSSVVKLQKVIDSIDPSRYGQALYYGEDASSGICSIANNFDAPPVGNLCAFKTFPDGNITKFYYKADQLAQVEQPGASMVDFGYDAQGRITSARDSLTNDVIAAGIRQAGDTEQYQIDYDGLSRVNSIKMAAPFGSDVSLGQVNPQPIHTFEYGSGSAKRHILGSAEPNGYQEYIEYDNLYRTTKACSKTADCSTLEWDQNKDLLLTTTDPLGIKTTTIYNQDDLPIEQYGGAPSSWFGADRRPTSGYLSQVPHIDTAYDEKINGSATAWYSVKAGGTSGPVFVGSPRLHTTGLGNANGSSVLSAAITSTSPLAIESGMDGIGFIATGEVRVPQTGTYTITLTNDDAAMVAINDVVIASKWNNHRTDTADTTTATYNFEAGKIYRFSLMYANVGTAGTLSLSLSGPGKTSAATSWLGYLYPKYNLKTSTKNYDSVLGNSTSVTSYGTNPEYGLATSETIDQGGQSLVYATQYESFGANSLMRPTSSSLPGGNTTNVSYYSATEKMDNPCTTTVESVSQAGRVKRKTEQDPDGTGSATSKNSDVIYDNVGRIVAARTNSDAWTCSTYDARGRITKTVQPAVNGRAGRTIDTIYSLNNDPLQRRTIDSVAGTTDVQLDLWARVISYKDVFGLQTTNYYDIYGRRTSQVGPVGTETAIYDTSDRLSSYSFNGLVYANIFYDQFSRVQRVDYPQAKDAATGLIMQLTGNKYDSLQRTTGSTVQFADKQVFDETQGFSTIGKTVGSILKFGTQTVQSSYAFDSVGRLTSASVGNIKYEYGFGTQASTCASYPGANANSNKDSNRTSQKITNITTAAILANNTYCYDMADRLINSSDTQIGKATYDDHGNTTQLAGGTTPIKFTYDANDFNTSIVQGTNKVEYIRDAQGNILRKKTYSGATLNSSLRYLAGGKVLQSCSLTSDATCVTVDTYLGLPGDVSLTLSPSDPTVANRTVYSIKNSHGDTSLTAGANGKPLSSLMAYGPFGEAMPAGMLGAVAATTKNATDLFMGWAQSAGRKIETLFTLPIIQMGARTYLPTLGRFLQTDPVQGGTPNAYTYVLDPINFADYAGTWGIPKWIKSVAKVVGAVVAAVATAVAVTVIAFAILAGSIPIATGLLAAAVVGAVGTVAAYASRWSGTKNLNKGALAQAGEAGGAVGLVAALAIVQLAPSATACAIECDSAYTKYIEGMNKAGISQNTSRVDSVLKPGAYRVPDGLDGSRLTEVKNTIYQPFSTQLRDYAKIAERDNLTFELHLTNPNVTISGPLEQAARDGIVNIIRY